jgi:hypothetical protein
MGASGQWPRSLGTFQKLKKAYADDCLYILHSVIAQTQLLRCCYS